eukprot:scaffold5655_cov119-Chaetoceros_neogracile.AAC.1
MTMNAAFRNLDGFQRRILLRILPGRLLFSTSSPTGSRTIMSLSTSSGSITTYSRPRRLIILACLGTHAPLCWCFSSTLAFVCHWLALLCPCDHGGMNVWEGQMGMAIVIASKMQLIAKVSSSWTMDHGSWLEMMTTTDD